MDYIYSKIDSNLLSINKIKNVILKKVEEENKPYCNALVGDYYLEFIFEDSLCPLYCPLTELNIELEDLKKRITELENK